MAEDIDYLIGQAALVPGSATTRDAFQVSGRSRGEAEIRELGADMPDMTRPSSDRAIICEA